MNSKEVVLMKSLNIPTIRFVASIPPEHSVTVSSSGEHLVYCDSPEELNVNNDSLFYIWGTGVGTTFKDIEMYQYLKNGWNNSAQLRVGLAIRNSNSTATTITYKCASGAIDGTGGDAAMLSITPGILRSCINKANSTISVPAYGTIFLCGYEGNFIVANAKRVSVRAQLKSSKASNVYVRTCVLGANNLYNVNGVFSVSTPETGESSHFCGELPYNQKIVSLDALNNYSYRFFSHYSSGINTNEYDTPYAYKTSGLSKHNGNYGVRYTLNITNASGKTLNVLPDWSVGGRSAASLLYKLNSGSWTVASVLSANMMWSFSLGSNSTATFSFYLAGGNSGDYLVYFS